MELQITFTKKELQDKAKEYMIELYGEPMEAQDKDVWMARFGLLCGFIDDQFTETPNLT